MTVRSSTLAVALLVAWTLGGVTAAGEVVLDMPPLPRPDARPDAAEANVAETTTRGSIGDVGAVALARYARARDFPRASAWSTWGWDSWRGWGWGSSRGWRWGGCGFGFPGVYAHPFGYRQSWGFRGGYRISLSPFQVFAHRAWNGGYVDPLCAW